MKATRHERFTPYTRVMFAKNSRNEGMNPI